MLSGKGCYSLQIIKKTFLNNHIAYLMGCADVFSLFTIGGAQCIPYRAPILCIELDITYSTIYAIYYSG